MTNDVIDLTGSAIVADNYLNTAVLEASGELVLTMRDGTEFRIDLTNIPNTIDEHVTTGYLDVAQNKIILNMQSGSVVEIPIPAGATDNTYIDVAMYNCNTDNIELHRNDGVTVTVDMKCFKDGIKDLERGGIVWNVSKEYSIGDIVTESGNIYIALMDSVGLQPSNNASAWKLVDTSGTEIAGKAWSSVQTYSRGDIVTDTSSPNFTAYVSIADNNTNNNPSNGMNPNYWRTVNSTLHNATSGGDEVGDGTGNSGMHNPTSVNGEYPDGSNETVGAMWTITGLGSGNTYTYTSGTLNGITVEDNDRISWAGGPYTNITWLYHPYPKVTIERGGLIWSSGNDYFVGDIVSYQPSGSTELFSYTCIQDAPSGTGDPDSAPTYWKKTSGEAEKGGVMFSTSNIYDPGDIVVDNIDGKIYKCIATDATSQPSSTPAEWEVIAQDDNTTTVADEAARLALDPVKKGDVVKQDDNNKVYKAVNATTGGSVASDWQEIGSVDSIVATDVGSTTKPTQIWAGTRTEYDNLGSYDSTTLYFIIG